MTTADVGDESITLFKMTAALTEPDHAHPNISPQLDLAKASFSQPEEPNSTSQFKVNQSIVPTTLHSDTLEQGLAERVGGIIRAGWGSKHLSWPDSL